MTLQSRFKSRFTNACALLAALLVACNSAHVIADDSEWHELFNGKDFDGWTVNVENPNSIVVEDGVIKVKGRRTHLFYSGPVANADFRNFEFRAMVKTFPNANSGIYFHTEYQDEDWPEKGFEVQVNNGGGGAILTGSLYDVADLRVPRENDPDFVLRYIRDVSHVFVNESPAKTGEWFEYTIIVRDFTVETRINGKTQIIWTQPEGWARPGRRIDSGTFALQAHDPGSEVHYKDIRVKILD